MTPMTMISPGHISDLDIQALIDAQFTPEDERLARWAIVSDSAFRQRYEDLVNQKQLLLTWWAQDGSRS